MSALESRIISTPRLDTHLWLAGSPKNPPLLLLHGNVSSAIFFDDIQPELAERYYVIAPDLRGYGRSQAKPVDATRGVADFSDDIAALLDSPELGLASGVKVHVVGWSAGANVALQLALDHGARVASLTLINPGSPYGFGGTKGIDGTPCYADCAGSGAGGINPQLVELLGAKDTSADHPVSPRNVMNTFYWKPPFKVSPEAEDRYVGGMLEMKVGAENYPGDAVTSPNWPTMSPGVAGMNNALSPKYLNQSVIVDMRDKPPILWIRGADDQIVSDRSMFDFAVLGELGVVPGWPGADVFPAQPMIAQTRAVLDRYVAAGGVSSELVFADTGHGPHIEKRDEFLAALGSFLAEHSG